MLALLRSLDERLSLFWKILIANSALLLLTATASTVTAPGFMKVQEGAVAVALVAVIVGVLSNSAIVLLALRPLARVVDVMRLVAAGDTSARCSTRGDPWARALGHHLNRMLDELELTRRQIARAAMEGEQAERRRLARDLHDDTAQRLTRVIMDLTSEGASRASLIAQVRATLESLRSVIVDLHPAVLDDLGFFAALRSLAKQKLSGLETHVDLKGEEPPPSLAIPLFRICQEALSNIHQHAHAHAVWIHWSTEPDGQVLTIEDDGVGLPADAGRRAQHFGLRTMQERIFAVGGQVDISSTGQGTSLVFRIPREAAS